MFFSSWLRFTNFTLNLLLLLFFRYSQFAFDNFAIDRVDSFLKKSFYRTSVPECNKAKTSWLHVSINHNNTVLNLSVLREELLHRELRCARSKSPDKDFPKV